MQHVCLLTKKDLRTCQSSLYVLVISELTLCSRPVISTAQHEDNYNCLYALLSCGGRGRLVILSSLLSPAPFFSGLPGRAKRDLTCAVKGHNSCSLSCRLRGLAGGECGWNRTSAAYDCICEEERRGVRCNVGGPNVCHVSCLAIGHTGGECDSEFNCQCSGRTD